MSTLDAQTQAFLDSMRAQGAPALCELPLRGARAALADLARNLGPAPQPVHETEERRIPGPAGEIPVRVYWPRPVGTGEPLPVVLHYHGGGYLAGDLDSHDRIARWYCRHADAIVISVDYRLAPEHRFPAAVEDAYAALLWSAEHALEIGAEGERIAVTGDSAGGNLSAVVCQLAAARGGPDVAFQALVYPTVDLDPDADYASRREFAEGYFLTARDIDWITGLYFEDVAAQARDPRASPIRAASLAGLPPALVVTAGCDPMRDEARAYAERLAAEGVAVEYRCFDGAIHGFLCFAGVLDVGREALALVADRLRQALYR